MLQSLVYLLCPLMMLACMGGFVRPRARNATPVTVRPLSRLADGGSRSPLEELVRLRAAQDELGRRIEILAAQVGEPDGDGRLPPVAGRGGQ